MDINFQVVEFFVSIDLAKGDFSLSVGGKYIHPYLVFYLQFWIQESSTVDFLKLRMGGTHIFIPSRFIKDDIFNLIKLGVSIWLGGNTFI